MTVLHQGPGSSSFQTADLLFDKVKLKIRLKSDKVLFCWKLPESFTFNKLITILDSKNPREPDFPNPTFEVKSMLKQG